MAEQTIGKITQVIGAVLDIKFAEGNFRRLTKQFASSVAKTKSSL